MSAESGRKFDYANHPILRDPATAYLSFLAFTTLRKKGDVGAGHRWAGGLFKGVFGRWPPRSYEHFVCSPEMMTLDVERFCRNEMARYSKTRGGHAAAA